jgi:predicted MFS family arabinose efflux permease
VTHPSQRSALWAAALGLVLLVGVFPQFALGALGPQIRLDLGITASDIGLLFSVLSAAGVLASPILGRIVDRTGGRHAAVALLALAGLSLVAASFARSRADLLLAMVPAGFAMAAANPATNRWASAATPARRQALLVGVGQASVQVGALMAGLLAAAVAVGLDWRGALRTAAALAVIGIVVAWSSPADDPGPVGPARAALLRTGAVTTGRERIHELERAGARRRVQSALGAYALAMGGGSALVLSYLPAFAVDRVGLSVAAAGSTGIVFGTVAIVTRLALSATLRDPDRVLARVLVLLSAGAALSIALIALSGERGPVLLWTGTVLFGATGTAWPMVAFLGVVRASGPGEAGIVTGWITAAFYTGLWITPLVGGVLLRRTGYEPLWMLAVAASLVAVVPALRTRSLATLDRGRAAPHAGPGTGRAEPPFR